MRWMLSKPMDRPVFLKLGKHRRWFWIICMAIVLMGLWELYTSIYLEEDKQLRRQLREAVKEKFPEQAAEFSKPQIKF
jgi:hypothetical protein